MRMGGIAFDLPQDVLDVRDGVLRFVEAQVAPRIERNHALLEDQRRLFDEDGRYSPEARELIREIRMLSAEAGFYAMCAPTEIGGGNLGHLTYYVAWEAIYHRLGGQGIIIPWVIAHWAFGPSRLLTRVTEEARRRCLDGMMTGKTSMCFGLSEPGAGSEKNEKIREETKGRKESGVREPNDSERARTARRTIRGQHDEPSESAPWRELPARGAALEQTMRADAERRRASTRPDTDRRSLRLSEQRYTPSVTLHASPSFLRRRRSAEETSDISPTTWHGRRFTTGSAARVSSFHGLSLTGLLDPAGC